MAGLTPQGFVIKDLQTIKLEIEADLKTAFGDDIDLSETSGFGQFVGNQALKYSNIWELMQTVYNSLNRDKASGVSLDGTVGLLGFIRLEATSSIAVVALYGTLGTVITAGHLVSQNVTQEQFALDSTVTIALSSVVDSVFSVGTVLDSQLYTVTINGTAFDYTSDGTATDLEIIAGLVAAITGGSEPVTVVDNLDGTARITADDGETAFTLALDINLSLDTIASPGDYTAQNTGSLSVPLNTLQNIITAVSGLDSVDNLATGFVGRDLETDEQFRSRARRSLGGLGRATDEAIRSRVLNEIDDVTAVTVISNRTDGVVSGRPAHSFETIVTGGDDTDIAEKIWENQPSGIQPHGDVTVVIQDSQGNNQTIKFSRPTSVYLWVDIDVNLNPEETFPANGSDLIKEAMVEFSIEEYQVGKDVIRQRLAVPTYTVPGIGPIDITLATSATPAGPPGAYTATDIVIADDEQAVLDTSRIQVNII